MAAPAQRGQVTLGLFGEEEPAGRAAAAGEVVLLLTQNSDDKLATQEEDKKKKSLQILNVDQRGQTAQQAIMRVVRGC